LATVALAIAALTIVRLDWLALPIGLFSIGLF